MCIRDRGETLDALLPEAFAVVREASRRVLGMRHFDVQLIGGMVLNDGKIAEMRTGEGKTLTATPVSYTHLWRVSAIGAATSCEGEFSGRSVSEVVIRQFP